MYESNPNLKAQYFLTLNQLLLSSCELSNRINDRDDIPPTIELLSLDNVIMEAAHLNQVVLVLAASTEPITEEIAAIIKTRFLKYVEKHPYPDYMVNLTVYGAQSTLADYYDKKPYILPEARKVLNAMKRERKKINPYFQLNIENMRKEFGFK